MEEKKQIVDSSLHVITSVEEMHKSEGRMQYEIKLVQLNIEQLFIYLPILTIYNMIGYLYLSPSKKEIKKKGWWKFWR